MGGGRKELAVGPLKSTASNAILTLPPFAIQALRHHRRQHRLRLGLGQARPLAALGLVDRPHALPDRASAVLVVVVGLVSVVVGALTGLLGWLSTPWLTVVPTATGSGAYLFQLFASASRVLVGNDAS